MYTILQQIVHDNNMHAKWLNTLSYMENAGARKISACESLTKVEIIQLKHAAEEHRHAYYLKKQIGKINSQVCTTYSDHELLASVATRQYLNSLDIKTCKYLQSVFTMTKEEMKFAAYLFVTYAIEVRADVLYPIYQRVLTETSSKIMVKSIILEEEGHLEEMISQLTTFSKNWRYHAEEILKIEEELHTQWIKTISKEVEQDCYAQ
ncbi:hypothetical protein [Chryseobacterium fistulae]|uniref:hypothetical protein n=1 Tax=Chryseobacterium fistulae TaxID=2675058 RepID=UPI001E52976E|nr:hypothetical protein [Chryseobacterium fistulae]